MAGTIVILNELADLGRPAQGGNLPEGRVSTSVRAHIDGPAGYQVRDGRADRWDVPPGTYQVRVTWTYFRTNQVTIEVTEGGRHHVAAAPTGYYSLTAIPVIGALPQLIGGLFPGLAIRLAPAQP